MKELSASERLKELEALKENWDTYGARPITKEAIEAARSFLSTLTVVPCSDGGVQIEAHAIGIDVEIEIGPNGGVRTITAE